jgi:acetolactate synthase I/II/III large subunit
MKLSDVLFDYLAERGIGHIFLVSGGGIMHLLDSVGRHPKIEYICNNHEQACVIAAEAYARVTGRVGACLVTTGPGATNALSAVPGAWVESIPILVISGQVRIPLIADYSRIRQLGPQEINIIPMAAPVTKYAKTIREPQSIREELDRALAAATDGRPGPVWLDVPLDVQAADVSPSTEPAATQSRATNDRSLQDVVGQTVELLQRARRPMLVAGQGIHLAHAENELASLLEATNLPVIMPISAMDLVPESYPMHMGAFGPIGRRAANFALQNSDLLLSIGASMSVASTGFNTAGFAPRAKKIIVNVDPGEIEKLTLKIDLPIVADAGEYLRELLKQLAGRELPSRERWTAACSAWKERYPAGPPPELVDDRYVNSYALAAELSEQMAPGEILVGGNSLDTCSIYQSFRVKKGQRFLANLNYGSMGWDLPAAVGACVAAGGKRVVLVTGDGSIQFNIQELETVRKNDLNLRIFVLNNEGYESIRTTQTNFFEGRLVGSGFNSGIGNPNFEKLAEAYGLRYFRLSEPSAVADTIRRVLASEGPTLCEVMVSPSQPRAPRATSFRREDGTMESRPIEDLFPFLPREEIYENMHMFDDEDAER